MITVSCCVHKCFCFFYNFENLFAIYFHRGVANVVHTRTWKITDAFCASLKFILIEVASLDFSPVHATDIFIKQIRTAVTSAIFWAIVSPIFFHLIWVVANTFIAIYQLSLDVYLYRHTLVNFERLKISRFKRVFQNCTGLSSLFCFLCMTFLYWANSSTNLLLKE